MPVSICGMHRSGTSMLVRLLDQCGLYLGPESDLTPETPSNERGHWENLRFLDLNDRLLAARGAGWDCPPPDPQWPAAVRDDFRPEAQALLDEFREREPWGWKDPRTSLTLPFWLDLIPELRVVILVRNPVEVARSLYKRNTSSPAFSARLWLTYHQRLLSCAAGEQRLITHYDAYFRRPESELRRVLTFIGFGAPDESVRRACAGLSSDLRHSTFRTDDIERAGLPQDVLDMYRFLCREAQWNESNGEVMTRSGESRTPADSDRDPRPETGGAIMALDGWRRTAALVRSRVLRLLGVEWAIQARDARIMQLRQQLEERMREADTPVPAPSTPMTRSDMHAEHPPKVRGGPA